MSERDEAAVAGAEASNSDDPGVTDKGEGDKTTEGQPAQADGSMDDARYPASFDITQARDRPPRRHIIDGLWVEKSVLAIVGEEGDGKTLLADQILRQMLRGDGVLDFFAVGAARPRRVLFVDTEMEEEDAIERDAEMTARGLGVQGDSLYWWSPGGIDLGKAADVEALSNEIALRRVDLVWIDSGINAVSDASEEVPVKTFFNVLSMLQRRHGLLGVGLSLHTRKRGQERSGRNFDDLFGSREWKGRPNTVLYIEGSTIAAWKNRGGSLRKQWSVATGRPRAELMRPGLASETGPPFAIRTLEAGAAERVDERENEIVEILGAHPDVYTKTDLARKAGGNRQESLRLIARLQAGGRVVPRVKGAKLRLSEDASGEVDPTADVWGTES